MRRSGPRIRSSRAAVATAVPVAARAVARVGFAAALAVGLATGATACVGSAPREPTLPTTDFRPKLVVEIHDGGLQVVRGPREDPAVVVDPPSLPGGSVVEVVNDDTRDRRLQGGTAFDTGTLHPGERTTVVLVNDTTEDKRVEVVDADHPDAKTTIVVTPRQH